jgi:hypothetical protein
MAKKHTERQMNKIRAHRKRELEKQMPKKPSSVFGKLLHQAVVCSWPPIGTKQLSL